MSATSPARGGTNPALNAGFSPQMHSWARQQGERLAACYLREDVCDRGDPEAYFERTAANWHLLSVLKESALPSFLDHVRAREAGTHG